MDEASQPSERGAELLRKAAQDLDALRSALGNRTGSASLPSMASAFDQWHQDVVRLASQVTSNLDLPPLLDTLVQTFVTMTKAQRGFLVLQDAQGKLERLAAYNLEPSHIEGRDFDISRGPVREAGATGRSIFVPDVLTQGQYSARQSVIDLKLRSFSCVPLVHGGRVVGVCYTDSREPGRVLTERERDLLESFAGHAAQAIENARRHGDLLDLKARLEAENEALRRQIERQHRFENILGESAPMQRMFATLEKVMATSVSVLIQGETGTGKELIARALHFNGPLRKGAFVSVNVAALPETLLESELFGHRRGAFTGAIEDRRGLFEEADGGTLFLDEIGEMSLGMQSKLLRVLQEGELRRVGDSTVRRVDVRVIAATNRDLSEEVRQKRFRQDLFYRLNVVCIVVPPLRQRGNDVLLLAAAFLRRFAAQHGKDVRGLAPEAVRWLLAQPWEGNVRELQNCIERAVTLCENGTAVDIGLLRSPLAGAPACERRPGTALRETLASVERDLVRAALEAQAGSRSQAARELGVSRQHLHNLMRKHGLQGAPRASRRSTGSD